MNKDQLMRNFTEEGRLNVLLAEDKKTKQYIATLGKTMQESLKRLGELETVTPSMYNKAQKQISDLDSKLKTTSDKIENNIKALMGMDSKNAKEIAKLDRQTKSLMDSFDRTTEKMANELSVIKGVVDTFSLVTHDKPKDGEQGLQGVGIEDAFMDMGHLKLKLTDGTVKDLGKIAYGNDVVPQIKKGGRGETGIGIKEIARTSGDGSPGTTDVYTITYTDASLTPLTYNVYNGKDGLAVVRDNLTTDSSTDALSAKQGKVLNDIVSTKANIVQEAWITPTLSNSATGTIKYRKNQFGELEFKGDVSIPSSSNQIMILPVGYRPQATMMFCVVTSSGTVSRVIVYSTGYVYLSINGTTVYVNGLKCNLEA